MKSDPLLHLTEANIKATVNEQGFQKGQDYAVNGAIFAARRTGYTLRADCEGSRGAIYQVKVTFDDTKIINTRCSCPIGAGGRCKHVAALLLQWKAHPEEFVQIPDVDKALNVKSKHELIEIITHLINAEPGLELTLALLLNPNSNNQQPPDPKIYARQVEKIFRANTRRWSGDLAVSLQLASVSDLAKAHINNQEYGHAWAVYHGVAQKITEYMEEYALHDEDGYITEVVNQCVAGLGECIKSITNDVPLRERVVQTLCDIYAADLRMGGMDYGYEAPELLQKYATPAEKEMVGQWIQEAIKKTGSWAQLQYADFSKNL